MATIQDECLDAFRILKNERKYRWVIYKIENLRIQVDKTGDRSDTYEDFVSALPGSNCRYALYDYEFSTQESHSRATSKLYFVMWSPPNSNDKDRVTYTQAMQQLFMKLDGTVKFNAAEEEDLEDLLQDEKQV